MSAQQTWLVTGASGFLGANLGAFLGGRAHRVGAVRSPEGPDALFDRYVAADLEDVDTLVSLILRERPDVVVHAAAMASHEACEADPQLARQVNTVASESLARAAEHAGSRFVQISTDAVFDGARGHYAEDDEASPTSVYGRTKLEAEQLVAHTGAALIVRTNFFGWSPTGQRSILEFFVNELSAGRPVRGFTDFTTTSAYAQVLAETIWQLLATDATGIFHVTSADAMTKYAFGMAVAGAFGLPSGLITPTTADLHPPRNADISLDVTKVEERLGQMLPTQIEGIRRALADSTTLRWTVATGSGL